MTAYISTKEKLKERIKELTCLYNVSSYIAISDVADLKPTFDAIAFSIKHALRHSAEAFVEIKVGDVHYQAGESSNENVYLLSAIKEFNVNKGSVKIGYSHLKYNENTFLEEEKKMLDRIAGEIGNLLERKHSIENEALTKRQLERVDRLTILGEITAGIAHELNTPLANILGFSELLKDRFKDDTVVLKDLDKIMNSAVYSREVVKKLMFFSCEMPQQMALTDITPIIKNAINLLIPNLTKKHLNIDLQLPDEQILLRVDSIQLTQVMFNLVMNASYFSPENGTINIRVLNENKKIELRISDEGPGIPVEKIEHIFNPFYTTKPVGEGSGLGLSVVHGIVKSHKGAIAYSSNSPKGATFTVTLPKL